MAYDVIVVGGGTAGCVLAARLSESPDRSVCLLEAGPDYGSLADGRWPPDLLDARALAFSHDWGKGGEDQRSLGARVIGGSSACNACMVVQGSPADYDEWGPAWTYEDLHPYLERARRSLRTAPANTDRPAPLHRAFVDAAVESGLPFLSNPDDPAQPVGAGHFPANVVDGRRWNASLAYLDRARGRTNLTIVADTLVDRVSVRDARASGVRAADGWEFEAETVILAAGAYFSPSILLRSGIGPEAELQAHGVELIQDLPVGERLLDHCGVGLGWQPSNDLLSQTAADADDGGLFEANTLAKAASSHCRPGSWDLHLLAWTSPGEAPGLFETAVAVFHMKPLSTGRLRLRSTDPQDLPIVERGFLTRSEDLDVLLEGIELARTIAAAEPLRTLLEAELRPGQIEPKRYVRETIRNYFHPAGTCPLGTVLDAECRVLGVDGLLVADASIMPTIPRANTNLTTAAIAERVAHHLG